MTAPAQQPIKLDFGVNFKPLRDRLVTEHAERIANGKRVVGFGIHCLDVMLGGVAHDDLILIGSRSGFGKTQMATLVAQANAGAKRRVHFFALEAADKEIERRIKYKLVSDLVFNNKALPKHYYARMNYMDWHLGRLDDITARYDTMADSVLADEYATLHVFYRERDFDVDQLERAMLAVQDQTDVLILDHVHFVDTDDPSENRGYKIIVKRIRDVALRIGKPVIVIAHVRKGERRGGALVPSLDDFHGTSDIPKIATKAIMLAPAFDFPADKPYMFSTYIAPMKCRMDGARCRYASLVQFDSRSGGYAKEFALGQFKNNGESFEITPEIELPYWALTDDQRAARFPPPQPAPIERQLPPPPNWQDTDREPGADG